jgi:hypothetical protein
MFSTSLFIPVKSFFICIGRCKRLLAGRVPHLFYDILPDPCDSKVALLALLPCFIGVRMSTGSHVFCNGRSHSASMEENDDLPAYLSVPYAAFFIILLFGA